MSEFTPKQRMLNAYRGRWNDCYAVAPEFWYYYPAKVLGVDMIEFQRSVPFWEALKVTFEKFGTEGWGASFPGRNNPLISAKSQEEKLDEGQFRRTTEIRLKGNTFRQISQADRENPSWTVEYPCKDEADVGLFVECYTSPEIVFDSTQARKAHAAVGESYLLEMWIGAPFFDFLAGFMGFEKAVLYTISEEATVLEGYRERYTAFCRRLVRSACEQTGFEAFAIGNSYSNNSLLGPELWRRWDKPFIRAIADEVHRHGRLLHIHFHGRCMETVGDFAEIGIDCVCPFERPPGGDVEGLEGLKTVRERLAGKVTMNGNVHTVETLIRGTPETVREEVRQIREAFEGEPRLIIGTGDQVGRETPEENIYAMIEAGKAGAAGAP